MEVEYKGVEFTFDDVVDAFNNVVSEKDNLHHDLNGTQYDILYEDVQYGPKILFGYIARKKGENVGDFASTDELRDQFAKLGFDVVPSKKLIEKYRRDEKKFKYFSDNQIKNEDIDNIEDIVHNKLGAPKWMPFSWKTSNFRFLSKYYNQETKEILHALYDETVDLKERVYKFRESVSEILTNDDGWKKKDRVDPGLEAATFFLSLNDYKKYLLFTRKYPYIVFSEKYHLGLHQEKNEDLYINFIKYCKEFLIPFLNKRTNRENNLLDCQDFIYYVWTDADRFRESVIEELDSFDFMKKETDECTQYYSDKLTVNVYYMKPKTKNRKFEVSIDSPNASYKNTIESFEDYEGFIDKINEILKTNGGNMPKQDEDIFENIKDEKNIILYGPPGTGKTYNTQKAIKKILELNNGVANQYSSKINDVVKGIKNWYEAAALVLYRSKESLGTNDIINNEIVSKFSETKNSKKVSNTISTQMMYHMDKDSQMSKSEKRYEPCIFDKDENSKWVLTEYGKEYVKEVFADELEILEGKSDKTYTNDPFYEFITFHQSYSYEEFVEGIKPYIDDDEEFAEKVSYVYNKGIFKEMCIRANSHPNNHYLLIIDEINRGNISKIFGELITLIEDDKRVVQNGELTFKNTDTGANNEKGLVVTLPYTKDKFGVPKNLYIVGTMNTSDRSIASVDIALRRRFKFKEMMPKSDLVADFGLGETVFKKYFEVLNQKISLLLDRDHQIGHSYFINTKYNNENNTNNLENLKKIWFDSVLPLLNEYFYGDWEKLQAILGEAKSDGNSFIKEQEISFNEDDESFKKCYDEENRFCFETEFSDDKFKSALEHAFK